MKLARADLPGLARPALILAASVAVAAFLPALGDHFREDMAGEQASADGALAAARARISERRADEENMGRYQFAYRQLLERGIVGRFSRIDLVERLDHAGGDLRYSISPELHAAPFDFFGVSVTGVLLQFEALHEIALADVLYSVESGTMGLPLVEGCSIDRLAGASGPDPRLKAVCRVSWITLEPLP